MNKRIVFVCLLVLMILVASSVYVLMTQQSDKSDDEIREMFLCHRITADVRATDIYCHDPDLYREHLKENRVIGPNDFDRLQ